MSSDLISYQETIQLMLDEAKAYGKKLGRINLAFYIQQEMVNYIKSRAGEVLTDKEHDLYMVVCKCIDPIINEYFNKKMEPEVEL